MLPIATLVTIVVSLLLAGLVAGLALRKRFANRDFRLIGESARVEAPLTPDGTVIIGGQLWRARSIHGLPIPSEHTVYVVEIDNLSLLVDACGLQTRRSGNEPSLS